MINILRPIAFGGLAIALATTGVAALGATNAHAAPGCNNDWRGDTICIHAANGEVFATGSWGNANNLPYIEIVNADTEQIVAGPVVDTHISRGLPHGRYFASYFVISDTPSAQPAQVDSPTIQN